MESEKTLIRPAYRAVPRPGVALVRIEWGTTLKVQLFPLPRIARRGAVDRPTRQRTAPDALAALRALQYDAGAAFTPITIAPDPFFTHPPKYPPILPTPANAVDVGGIGPHGYQSHKAWTRRALMLSPKP